MYCITLLYMNVCMHVEYLLLYDVLAMVYVLNINNTCIHTLL